MQVLGGLGKALSQLIPGKKKGTIPLSIPTEEDDVISQLASLGIGAPPATIPDPTTAPALIEPGPAQTDSQRILSGIEDLMRVAQTPAPTLAKAQVNPIEQLLELYAVSQGGASNVGGAYDLASARAGQENAAAMQAWESKVKGAETGLKYGVPLFNAVVDRETALDTLENKLKIAGLQGQAKQAAQQVKNDKEARFKIGDLVAKGQATVPAIAQILIGTGAPPDLANATAEEVIKDIQANGMSWYQQHQADKLELQQQKFDEGMSFKQIKEWNDILEDPGAKFTQQVQAATNLINAGQFPPGSDPVAIAKEVSTESKRIIAQTALTSERTEVEKIKKQITKEELKALPEALRDKHAKNLAQIRHWENMDRLAARLGDFQMVKDAKDNIIQRYSKALDAFGSDIVAIDKDLNSLEIDRRQWVDLRKNIPTKGARKDGMPIAAKPEDQHDLDVAVRNIDRITKQMEEKHKAKAALSGEAGKLRSKMQEEDIEAEVEKGRTKIEIPAPATSSNPKPKAKTDIAALRKKYGY